MKPTSYRITTPTIVLIAENGRQVAHTVPKGAIVTIDVEPVISDKLIPVKWHGDAVLMFAVDLRTRGERVD
jgi:hypothetical protein